MLSSQLIKKEISVVWQTRTALNIICLIAVVLSSFLIARSILHTMYMGVALLIPGTILGGVWAAESWGRFWDWGALWIIQFRSGTRCFFRSDCMMTCAASV